MAFAGQLARALAPIRARIANLIVRGVVRLVDDSKRFQVLQTELLALETRDGVERWQAYGLSSRPHPDAEVLVLFPGGSRSHAIAVAVDDRRHRPTGLAAGEVVVYTDEGTAVALRRGQLLELAGDRIEGGAATHVLLSSGTSSIRIEPGRIVLTADQIDLETP